MMRFEVQPGWFEVLLPPMQLVRTPSVPAHLQAKADFTLERLKLINGPKVRRIRWRYYEDFKKGKLNLSGLQDYAPPIADAVSRLQADDRPLP
jgi:hypothetical protein